MGYTPEMTDEIVIDGEQYISSKRAAQVSGYTQDYVGQLCRGGSIQARRVGGLWYVALKSLQEHQARADEYKPTPPPNHQSPQQESLLSFDGKTYVSAPYAARITGYSSDYVGQLARSGTILSRQVGSRWYVDRQAIIAHKESKDALLAAVQAESVGIPRRDEALSGLRYTGGGPFLTYTRDMGALMPEIAPKSEHEENVKEEVRPVLSNAVPIRVVHRSLISPERSPQRSVRRASRVPALSYLALPVATLTIVIVLGVSFVSLKDSARYTGRNVSVQSAAANVSMSLRNFISRIGDYLEVWITPELVFRRDKR